MEELLSLLPDPSVGAVIERKKARQESLAEHLRALTRKQRREVINADNAERETSSLQTGDGNCRLIESGRNVVQRNGVQRVGASED